jgi:hypothetical protein
MRYSEFELIRITKMGHNKMTIDDEITFNILNFIRCIHLNNQDFYKDAFDSKMFGNLEMVFRKNGDCLFGHCRVVIKKDNSVLDYVFSADGFELLGDVV